MNFPLLLFYSLKKKTITNECSYCHIQSSLADLVNLTVTSPSEVILLIVLHDSFTQDVGAPFTRAV